MSVQRKPLASYLFFWLGIAICLALAKFIWPGKGYYLLSMVQRPLHPYHEFLRSSSRAGLSFGLIGITLVFLNLTYLIRARLIYIEWLGSLRNWMSFHVFTGLIGPLFILFHSSFVLRSPPASIAFLAMMVVVSTGLVGRYIYSHTPRSVKGKELELEEIRRNLGVYRADLQKLGMPVELFETTSSTLRHVEPRGIMATLFSFLREDYGDSPDYQKLRELVLASPHLRPTAQQILSLGQKYFKERQWMDRYYELRSIMGSWRFFHRWFAIVMLVLAGFHIFIAIDMSHLSLPTLNDLRSIRLRDLRFPRLIP